MMIETDEMKQARERQEVLAGALIETLQGAMFVKFNKEIEVMLKNDDGGLKPYFRFKKPGLMPTAIEKAYFDGVAEGFRNALGVLLRGASAPAESVTVQ